MILVQKDVDDDKPLPFAECMYYSVCVYVTIYKIYTNILNLSNVHVCPCLHISLRHIIIINVF